MHGHDVYWWLFLSASRHKYIFDKELFSRLWKLGGFCVVKDTKSDFQ